MITKLELSSYPNVIPIIPNYFLKLKKKYQTSLWDKDATIYRDKMHWIIADDITIKWEYDNNGIIYWLKIKRGWITDFASVPQVVHSILSPTHPKIIVASLVHDAGFVSQHYAQKYYDDIFYDIMKKERMNYVLRNGAYMAVRIGGSKYWNASTLTIDDNKPFLEWGIGC